MRASRARSAIVFEVRAADIPRDSASYRRLAFSPSASARFLMPAILSRHLPHRVSPGRPPPDCWPRRLDIFRKLAHIMGADRPDFLRRHFAARKEAASASAEARTF